MVLLESTIMVDGPTTMLPALAITKTFHGNTTRDTDSLFWVSVRGGIVALGHANSWAAAGRLQFIIDEIMHPLAKALSENNLAACGNKNFQTLYRRWGMSLAGEVSSSSTSSALWSAYMAVIEDYRLLRDLCGGVPPLTSDVEAWCMAGIEAVRTQPAPGSRAVLSWHTCSVVLPAYNEQEAIANTALECVKTLWQLCPKCEVIIVDDGSADNTGLIADDLAANDATIVAVHNRPNKGYGGALRTGLESARGDLLFFMDSDGQFDFTDISKLLVVARHHPGTVVLGYRAHRSDPFMRKLNALGWKFAARMVVGLRDIRDIDCAFKLFPASAFFAADLIAQGASINVELLVKFQRMGVPIVQLPVTHLPRRSGSPTGAKLHVIMRAFRELFRLRSHLRYWHPQEINKANGPAQQSLARLEATISAASTSAWS